MNPEFPIPKKFHKIVTDTRCLEKDDIFVALKGKFFDGHSYIEEAVQKGASCIFVEAVETIPNVLTVQVKDTYQALFDMSKCYLKQYPVSVVAVTGSVGKTTTKELISCILSQKYQVLKSHGNKNNRIGIPQTIFELNSNYDVLVVELGMNHFHEIEVLSKLVHPDAALITNIGSAHIGNLGSKQNILKAKMEITAGMNGGILIVNGHDSLLSSLEETSYYKVQKCYKDSGRIQIELLKQTIFGSEIRITNGIESRTIFFEHPGVEILEDIMLALSIGELFEIPFLKMIEGLKEYHPIQQRFFVESLPNGNILINDCYNSSYESLKMDINLLKQYSGHKILILGDILELGKSSKKIHRKIGKEIRKLKDVDVYFIGTEMKEAYKKYHHGKYFLNKQEWIPYWQLKGTSFKESVILLKGSRKMKLEDLIPYFL